LTKDKDGPFMGKWLGGSPEVKAAAVALLESGAMRVSEVAELIGVSRQRVAGWCPGAKAARARWLAGQWRSALAMAQAAEAARIKTCAHSDGWKAYLLEELDQRCARRLDKLTVADERRLERRLVELWNAVAPEFRRALSRRARAARGQQTSASASR
jgi:transposase-like protein